MSNTVDGKIMRNDKELKEMLSRIETEFLEGKTPPMLIDDKSDMVYDIEKMLVAIVLWFNDAPKMSLQEKKHGFKRFLPHESKQDNRLKFALDITNDNNYSIQVLFQTNFGTLDNEIYRITFGIKNGN